MEEDGNTRRLSSVIGKGYRVVRLSFEVSFFNRFVVGAYFALFLFYHERNRRKDWEIQGKRVLTDIVGNSYND